MLLFGNNATLKALSRAFEMLKWTVMGLLTAPHSPQLSTVDSTVDSYMFTCPAITVATVILRALDRVRERALGCCLPPESTD